MSDGQSFLTSAVVEIKINLVPDSVAEKLDKSIQN